MHAWHASALLPLPRHAPRWLRSTGADSRGALAPLDGSPTAMASNEALLSDHSRFMLHRPRTMSLLWLWAMRTPACQAKAIEPDAVVANQFPLPQMPSRGAQRAPKPGVPREKRNAV